GDTDEPRTRARAADLRDRRGAWTRLRLALLGRVTPTPFLSPASGEGARRSLNACDDCHDGREHRSRLTETISAGRRESAGPRDQPRRATRRLGARAGASPAA